MGSKRPGIIGRTWFRGLWVGCLDQAVTWILDSAGYFVRSAITNPNPQVSDPAIQASNSGIRFSCPLVPPFVIMTQAQRWLGVSRRWP
jgi:hypothetical protein